MPGRAKHIHFRGGDGMKPLSRERLEQVLTSNNKGGEDSHIAAQFEVEITFLKRRATVLGPLEGYRINEALLKDQAFPPKRFAVSLEKDSYWLPAALRFLSIPAWVPRYVFCLLFDKSPYPPREEWKSTQGRPNANKFWELREFCSRKLPREAA
ncbi:hypothetical protein K469DRAFT_705758 [Zopfia rhizophila CBS 207.26]|uniref:Uncharacterized protein n=1 Tax=Zopfia rhizophila CBS 207.26 TaxID=1314779 RepID=A0A6A6EAP5_9PEZI|nr:hypothetical protein K469DRAFT_705758 [Zopfia rhizophila CBS 207.26]